MNYSDLYKYTSPDRADKIVTRGEVRVGTLHDFRRIEAVGAERADPLEGIKITATDGRAGTFNAETLPPFLQASLKLPPGVKVRFEEGAVIALHASHPDMYVYCVSDRFDQAQMAKFGGACVRINDPKRFFDAITLRLPLFDENGMREPFEYQLAACEYGERRETWPKVTNYNPAFRKSSDYVDEHEVRAAWRILAPSTRTLAPVNLVVPSLSMFCERIR